MKILLLLLYLLTLAAGLWLRALNLRHLKRHGATVPPEFAGAVDPEVLRRTAAYTLAQSRLGLVESLFGAALTLAFLFGGLLPLYDRWVASLSGSFVLAGLLFFLGLQLAQTLLDIPFSLYRNFMLEARFGFNVMSGRLWLTDLVKSTLLSLVLLGLLTAGALAIIQASPQRWWLWVWALVALVTLFLMYLSPTLIEPLFYKFEPVRDEELKARIEALTAKAGLQVSAVQQVDASRRSRHSNAYFTGIGRVKRIVLFDTLLAQMTHDEILAILAHEAGHWKQGHIRRRLWAAELLSLAAFCLAFHLLQWGGLPQLLGFPQSSFFAQVVILGFLGSLVSFPLTPFGSWLSRRHERQADRFACRLTGEPASLASALIKLAKENLANLHPHPLYAWFHYSHPPIVVRVRELRRESG
ncbi:MAG TPA: M48 family metallopeptidase [Desulfuromonadales bacterium]|nr:M48 family metallopeptidase [Desulfuromonadales bacterium]